MSEKQVYIQPEAIEFGDFSKVTNGIPWGNKSDVQGSKTFHF